MIKFILLFAGVAAAYGQSISIGAKGGSPLNDPSSSTSAYSTITQDRWTGGPAVELGLPLHFSIEFDALYRGSKGSTTAPYTILPGSSSVLSSSTQRTRAWDLPLLLKYHFLNGPIKPFLSAGYQWSHETTKLAASSTCLGAAGSCDSPYFLFGPNSFGEYSRWRTGPVFGAGAEFKTHRIFITPEVRVASLRQPNTNQVTMLVGFTLRPWRIGANR